MTQPQLARRVGRDPARISEIERDLLNSRLGRDRLTLLGEICDALDLRIVLATPAQAEAIRLQQPGNEQPPGRPSQGSATGSAFEDLFVDLSDDEDGKD